MLDTFVGTVKELLTVAAPNADNAWNVPAVVVLCVTLLLIAIAIVFP
jgi:phage-related minor tail protein